MTNVIDCEIKQFGYAKRQQQGYRTVYLDNVYKQSQLTNCIKNEIQAQKTIAQKTNIDTKKSRNILRHGARSKTLFKSIEQAWQDIEKKLKQFELYQNTKKPVNWSEGEIKMFNGLAEIFDQELQQQGFDPDEYSSKILFVLRMKDSDGQTVCRFPLPEHSIEWDPSHPDFDQIMTKIDHLNRTKPEKCF